VFAKARAVAALAFAGNEDSFRGATESIYEAAATIGSDDKGELFGLSKVCVGRMTALTKESGQGTFSCAGSRLRIALAR
jgi:hypothetical protein